MIRKTLTILSLIGLLLSVAACILASRFTIWDWGDGTDSIWFNGNHIMWLHLKQPGVGNFKATVASSTMNRIIAHEDYLGWPIIPNYYEVPVGGSQSTAASAIQVPLWIPTVAFGATFYLCRPLHFHRRRKRKKLGLCIKCGYDLRGSKDRCPECGEAIA